MNRFILIILLSLISSVLVKSQRTVEYGNLLRINYKNTDLDTSSIGSWITTNGVYEGREFSSHSEYYKVFNYNGSTYGLIHNSEWGLLAGFGLDFEKLENSDKTGYFHDYGEYDIISPFTIFNSNIIPDDNGVYLLNGEIQQCFVEITDDSFIKSQFNFQDFDEHSMIIGLLNEHVIVVTQEYNFYLCSIDNLYTIAPVKPIYVESPVVNGMEALPNFVSRLHESYYLGNTNYGVSLIYQYIPDSLQVNSVIYTDKAYAYDNTIYYLKDHILFKNQFDSLSGSYDQKTELLNGLYWEDLGFPEAGSAITYWKGDTIFVYDLDKEKNIYEQSLNRYNYSNNTPLIDSQYVYLHKTVKITEVKQSDPTPNKFNLSQNYPNPFNPTTTIRYTIPFLGKEKRSGLVTLKVNDILGREVATLVNEQQKPGIYVVEFNGDNFPSGVYFYSITAGIYSNTRKMLLLK